MYNGTKGGSFWLLLSEWEVLGKNKTIGEFIGVEDLTSDGRFAYKLSHKPLEIFLEDSFTIDTEIIAQSIKSGLGSYWLSTAIKDGHVVIRNLSDFVAMKANNRDASFRIKMHRSVTRFPIFVRLNSGTHLLFDLTHVWWVSEVKCGRVVAFPPMWPI